MFVFRGLCLLSLRLPSKPALSAIVFIKLFNLLTLIALAVKHGSVVFLV